MIGALLRLRLVPTAAVAAAAASTCKGCSLLPQICKTSRHLVSPVSPSSPHNIHACPDAFRQARDEAGARYRAESHCRVAEAHCRRPVVGLSGWGLSRCRRAIVLPMAMGLSSQGCRTVAGLTVSRGRQAGTAVAVASSGCRAKHAAGLLACCECCDCDTVVLRGCGRVAKYAAVVLLRIHGALCQVALGFVACESSDKAGLGVPVPQGCCEGA